MRTQPANQFAEPLIKNREQGFASLSCTQGRLRHRLKSRHKKSGLESFTSTRYTSTSRFDVRSPGRFLQSFVFGFSLAYPRRFLNLLCGSPMSQVPNPSLSAEDERYVRGCIGRVLSPVSETDSTSSADCNYSKQVVASWGKPMVRGEIWYVLSRKWLQQFCDYTGFNAERPNELGMNERLCRLTPTNAIS